MKQQEIPMVNYDFIFATFTNNTNIIFNKTIIICSSLISLVTVSQNKFIINVISIYSGLLHTEY